MLDVVIGHPRTLFRCNTASPVSTPLCSCNWSTHTGCSFLCKEFCSCVGWKLPRNLHRNLQAAAWSNRITVCHTIKKTWHTDTARSAGSLLIILSNFRLLFSSVKRSLECKKVKPRLSLPKDASQKVSIKNIKTPQSQEAELKAALLIAL